MSDTVGTRNTLVARLEALRARLQALMATFHDPDLKAQCAANITDVQLVASLVTGVRAEGSVRAFSRMVEVRAKQVEYLEKALAEHGPAVKPFC